MDSQIPDQLAVRQGANRSTTAPARLLRACQGSRSVFVKVLLSNGDSDVVIQLLTLATALTGKLESSHSAVHARDGLDDDTRNRVSKEGGGCASAEDSRVYFAKCVQTQDSVQRCLPNTNVD